MKVIISLMITTLIKKEMNTHSKTNKVDNITKKK